MDKKLNQELVNDVMKLKNEVAQSNNTIEKALYEIIAQAKGAIVYKKVIQNSSQGGRESKVYFKQRGVLLDYNSYYISNTDYNSRTSWTENIRELWLLEDGRIVEAEVEKYYSRWQGDSDTIQRVICNKERLNIDDWDSEEIMASIIQALKKSKCILLDVLQDKKKHIESLTKLQVQLNVN